MDPISFERYKQRRNEVRDRIIEAKRIFFKDKTRENRQEPKKLSQVGRELNFSSKRGS